MPSAADFFGKLVDPGVLHHLAAPRCGGRVRACLNRPSAWKYGTALWVGAGGDHSLCIQSWLSGRELDGDHVTGYADESLRC